MNFIFGILVITSVALIAAANSAASSDKEVFIDTFIDIEKPVELQCKIPLQNNQSLVSCLWEKVNPNGKAEIEVLTPNSGSKSSINPNFEYFGNRRNECGLRIMNVTHFDFGKYRGTLNLARYDESMSHTCSFTLVKLEVPSAPEILNKGALEVLVDNGPGPAVGKITRDLVCCARGGVPPPELTFVFDEDNVSNAVSKEINNKSRSVCITWTNVELTWDDDGKEIDCVLKHVTQEKDLKDSVTLYVKYSPHVRLRSDREFVVSGTEPMEFSHSDDVEIEVTQCKEYTNTIKLKVLPNPSQENISVLVTNDFGQLELNVTHEDLSLNQTQKPNQGITPANICQKNPGKYKGRKLVPIGNGRNKINFVALGWVTFAFFIVQGFLFLGWFGRKKGWFCFMGRVRSFDLTTAQVEPVVNFDIYTDPAPAMEAALATATIRTRSS